MKTTTFSFTEAMRAMNNGFNVCRNSWPEGTFMSLVPVWDKTLNIHRVQFNKFVPNEELVENYGATAEDVMAQDWIIK